MKQFIQKNHLFEPKESLNMLEGLKYYSKFKNIANNKEIYILDIGGNIGWYPSLLGLYNYSVISFEPRELNYYISRKNYCYLNRNSNIVIVTKGLNKEEQICYYYKDIQGTTNGMTLCNNKNEKISKRFKKISTVYMTKLSNFIPFLSDKNIALIKMDVEGSEGIIIESGIELITKYHVPFIFIEFTPSFLLEHNTEPKNFLELFTNNGYKISLEGFLSKNFISAEELMKETGFQINSYFIHTSIINN